MNDDKSSIYTKHILINYCINPLKNLNEFHLGQNRASRLVSVLKRI